MDIKGKIKQQGYTISEVAAKMTTIDADGNVKIGISQSALSQMITGNPTLQRLKEIASIIGVRVSDLVGDDFTAFVRNGKELKVFDSISSLQGYIANYLWCDAKEVLLAEGQKCITKGENGKYARHDEHLCVWDGENFQDVNNGEIVRPYAYLTIPPLPCDLMPKR